MSRRLVANLTAGTVALLVGTLTLYVSYTRLKMPELAMDWAAFILSGMTTGIIAFFIVWGHFQKDPQPTSRV